jgi:dipeptidyl aminopeptidase/acylaminoacyl peptidase
MKKAAVILIYLLAISSIVRAQQNASVSFEQFLSLRQAGSPAISPDGKNVAFTITSTDWKENGYDTEIWISKGWGEPFQLTRTTKGSSNSPRWSPEGKWIGFYTEENVKVRPEGTMWEADFEEIKEKLAKNK